MSFSYVVWEAHKPGALEFNLAKYTYVLPLFHSQVHNLNDSLFGISKSLMKTFSLYEYGSRAQGWAFLMFGFLSFLLFIHTAIISKLLPLSNNPILAAVQKDRYYCFLVPLLPLILLVAVYFHWLTMKLYKHA